MMNCDRIAPVYEWLENAAFNGLLQRMRVHFLERAAAARRVLLLGEGNGRFLAECLRVCPRAEVEVVDSSEEMIAQARRRIGATTRVRFIHLDVLSPELSCTSYDVIATHFFLDCLRQEEVNQLAMAVSRILAPDGLWLVSEFAVPRRGWRRIRARLWLAVLYRFFRLTTGLEARRLPDYRSALLRAGLTCESRVERSAGFVTSEIWRHGCA
jgi:ubiquinone/menaquinone biosynthesis C-methylase UbiE